MRTLVALILALSLAAPAWAQPGGTAGRSPVDHAATLDKAAVEKTNVTTDTTDVWWPDAESGWGAQLFHQRDVVFVTIFVFGPGKVPTFYVAALFNTPFGSGTFTGTLYSATGTPIGSPWNPADVSETAVGTMTFTLTGIGTGTLAYNVGAINVSKTINRQAFRFEDNSGDYVLTDTYGSTMGGCGTGIETGTLNIVQTGTSATLTINWDGNICTFPTTYSQLGRLGQYQGTMSCSNGTTGTANFFEVHNRVKMLTGRYNITNSFGCPYTGRFAAIAPTP